MARRHSRSLVSLHAVALATLGAGSAYAQDAAAPAPADTAAAQQQGSFLDEIVVTAVPTSRSKMQSSVSVTDISAESVQNLAPRSEAEVFRLIPGIRAESTAGPGGNSNITVRGLPLASGGSKYVQLQEDGVPVVEFGDIAFGNNDYWTRYDLTVDRVQAIRGGSASTFASQAPGAVINYVSKTGEKAGGEVRATTGIGYNESRLDFNVGGPINSTLRANVGGFYRTGDGPRDTPWHALEGYQIKGNVTQTFDADRGYVRLLFKVMNDRAPTYTASPMQVSVEGNKITGYSALPGFDARSDTNFSNYNRYFTTVNPDGSVKRGDNADGIHVKSRSVGAQLHWGSGAFEIDDKFAYSWNSGKFSAPFLGSLTSVAGLTTGAGAYSIAAGGTTYTAARAVYANGPKAGQTVAASTVVNQNPNLYTDMTGMDHWANDLGVTGKFDLGTGKVTGRAGWYHSRQQIAMNWHWNASLTEATPNGALIDLYSANGTRLTDAGLTGYNNMWGGNDRQYDLHYTTDAPYLSLNYADDALDLDGSVRFDNMKGGGTFYPTGARTSRDINGDGVLSVAERNVYLTNFAGAQPIDYKIDYTSWSLGGNYRFTPSTSAFVRISRGNRANADRVVSDFAGAFTSTGQLTSIGQAVVANPVTQQEFGVKQRGRLGGGNYGLFVTGFRSQATEYNFDLTTQRQTFQRYKTWGIELESQYTNGGFSLLANVVYTHSRIAEDLISGNAGKTPRATPDLMYTIAPTYDFGKAAIGFTLIGQTNSYPQDDNLLKQKGSNIVSAFVRVRPLDRLEVSINANNLFNAWDQAGRLDQGSVADLAALGKLYGVPYAATNRVGQGRTVSVSAGYRF